MTALIVEVSAIITGVMAIAGFVMTFYKIIKRFEKLEESVKARKDESNILLKSMNAVLDGLIQMNCNGPVTHAKEELQEYLYKRGD